MSLKTYTYSLINQKELEEDQRLIEVNQIKRSELKANQMIYTSSKTFERQMVSQYTLKFAEFQKTKSKIQSKVEQPVETTFRQ